MGEIDAPTSVAPNGALPSQRVVVGQCRLADALCSAEREDEA